MNPELRRSAAHVVVGDVDAPALTDATAHHLLAVLRLRDGERVTVTDGAGRWRACVLSGGALEPAGEPQLVEAPASPFTLLVAIPKADRPEWLVQKATELGVDRIVLLHAARSVVRWDGERGRRHVDKLRRVAVEAAMQSRRVRLPAIEGPVDARAVLADAVVAEPGGRPLSAHDRAVAIGPEGGWTDDELAVAHDRVGLGSTVLRVETAAVAACAIAAWLRAPHDA